MEKGWHPIILLYRILLKFFPRRFRAEFGVEMQGTFVELYSEAVHEGSLSALIILFREYLGLPIEALRQNLNLHMKRVAWLGPATRGELLVAMLFFILPSIYIALDSRAGSSLNLIWTLLSGIILLVILTGLMKGLPRWSLPFLGLALALISFIFVFEWMADLFAPAMMARIGPIPQDESARIVMQIFWAGLLWLSLLIFTILILGVLNLLNRFGPFLESIRKDWTLVSYILYYAATFTLFLAYDQYRVDYPFAFASAICLACGAWFYLHASSWWQRILALLSGLSLAMLAAMAAHWSFIPGTQEISWPLAAILSPDHWSVSIWSIFDWVWITLILLIPVLLRFFDRGTWRTT
jgi:hypothetical protein